ncbi:MAG: CBS domain-containing protein [Streptomycetaceae bacterium]|nr:CBS domain-containing protein [Streptomycetaceae bacterium]
MGHQLIRSFMTTDVVTIGPDAHFTDIVRILRSARISAVPVVAVDGRILGVVSEADLLRKEAHADDACRAPARRLFGGRGTPDKSRAEVARDLMTSPAVTIRADGTVVDAARLMERRGVKRLPVVDADGRLEGVVSRCDLLRVFLRGDREIHDEIVGDVLRRALWINPATVSVTVDGGRVHLAGSLETRSLVPLVVRLCRAVDGVVGVTHDLRYDYDDTHVRPGSRGPRGITDTWMARL